MITIDELQAIRARWQAATPGPWARCSANDGDCACGLVWDAEGMAAVAAIQEHNELGEGLNHAQYRSNWDAVTAAPTDVATLLAALDAAQAEHAVLVTWLHEALDAGDISLVWQKDCACTHCETDRQRARLMQRGRTSDGAPPVPAVAPWWEREE